MYAIGWKDTVEVLVEKEDKILHYSADYLYIQFDSCWIECGCDVSDEF